MTPEQIKAYGIACATAALQQVEQGGANMPVDAIVAAVPVPDMPLAVDWRDAVADAVSVLGTINTGPAYAIKRGDELVYWQRDEWITWAQMEVLPKLQALLVSDKAKGDADARHPA